MIGAILNGVQLLLARLTSTRTGHLDNIPTINTNVGSNDDAASSTGSVHAKIKELRTLVDALETDTGLIKGYTDALESNLGTTGDAANASGTVLARLAELLTNRLTAARAGYLDVAISSRSRNITRPQIVDYSNASAAADTWYTALNITGAGCLYHIAVYSSVGYEKVRVTVNDVLQFTFTSVSSGTREFPSGISRFLFNTNFSSSLLVEIASNVAGSIVTSIDYGLA